MNAFKSHLIGLCVLCVLSACDAGEPQTAAADAAPHVTTASLPASSAPSASMPQVAVSDIMIAAPPAASSSLTASDAVASMTASSETLPNTLIDDIAMPAATHHIGGMHPICETYLQVASACFQRAPAHHAPRLMASLHASREELRHADADTCTMVRQQFDEWAQQVDCR